MKKRIIITAIIVALVHLVLSFGSFIISISSGLSAFDNPDYQRSFAEKIINIIAYILMQPCYLIWSPWMGKNLPDIVEWILFLSNSLLWGLVIALCINLKVLMKKRNQKHRTE
jgi:hypothetical protein